MLMTSGFLVLSVKIAIIRYIEKACKHVNLYAYPYSINDRITYIYT